MSFLPMRKIQEALRRQGLDVGPVDGVFGPLTRGAIRSYQDRTESPPGTGFLNPRTVRSLLGAGALTQYPELMAPWLCVLLAYKGLHEVNDNARLWRWLRSDGNSLGDPARNPWCGDAVQTAMAIALPHEPLPSNPYLAKNWGRFGYGIGRSSELPVGCVVDFWRGDPTSTFGHVAFLMGETATHYIAAGGNQQNRITDNALIAKNRLRAARWPASVPIYAPSRLMTPAGAVLSVNEA